MDFFSPKKETSRGSHCLSVRLMVILYPNADWLSRMKGVPQINFIILSRADTARWFLRSFKQYYIPFSVPISTLKSWWLNPHKGKIWLWWRKEKSQHWICDYVRIFEKEESPEQLWTVSQPHSPSGVAMHMLSCNTSLHVPQGLSNWKFKLECSNINWSQVFQ